jgi:hypothetical protein
MPEDDSGRSQPASSSSSAELGQRDDAKRSIHDAIDKVERSQEKWCEAEGGEHPRSTLWGAARADALDDPETPHRDERAFIFRLMQVHSGAETCNWERWYAPEIESA